ANGEANDTYTGSVIFSPSVMRVGPGPIVFEETFEAWPPVPSNWGFTVFSNGSISVSSSSHHRGTNQLSIQTPGGDTSSGAHSQTALLVLDLSSQLGETNLFLDFWA